MGFSRAMSVSIRKIQEILSDYFAANGWEWSSTWQSESHPTVLTEFWTVQSRWSPSDFTVYIGFENWDIYESVGLSMELPVAGEKNEWLERVALLKGWRSEFDGLLESIQDLRGEHGIRGDESPP